MAKTPSPEALLPLTVPVFHILLAVAGEEVSDLAGLFRRIWSLGQAGVEVPLLIYREGRTTTLRVRSGDRNRFLKSPSLH